MPRKPRVTSSTGYYHVMVRGINKEIIFKTSANKEMIYTLIKDAAEKENFEIGAWCIMDNHIHLLIKSDLESMAKIIKVMNLKYGAYYNNENNRSGPVFGDRYRSENIEDEKYLLEVLRYIHNNPVKAKKVNDPSGYKWSSYNQYTIEKKGDININQRNFIKTLFGNNMEAFIEFHKIKEEKIFLDLKEDMESQKIELSHTIIKEYFIKNEITGINELKSRPNLAKELIIRLSLIPGMTIRQMSDLTGVSIGTIHNIIKEYRHN
jgi:REP element-mobilizing transposase RayT